MKLTFLHHGQERSLTKHPRIAAALKAGQITEADAATKPWYLRMVINGAKRPFKMAALGKKEVVTEARDFLNSRATKPNEFAAFLAAKDAQRSLTIGQLAKEWYAAGLPFSKTKPRKPAAVDQLQSTLDRALPWWEGKHLATITTTHHEDYVVWRRANVTRGTGSRSADLELSALSSLCQWGILTGRLEKNPFATRDRYHDKDDVRHCHEFAPRSDDDFHAILRWFWRDQADRDTMVAGAWLCFTGLVGIRPEEPAALQRVPRLDKTPADTKSLTPGTIFPMRDGTLKMRIWRNKKGQNPFVALHPAALQFLNLWSRWLDAHPANSPEIPDSSASESQVSLAASGPTARWFPGIETDDTSILNRRMAAACEALKLGEIKPKGFGRAYYVRCRRSAGIEDSQIAMELGQTTNGKLIRDTYGDPDDLFGSGLFDWLPDAPENPSPAWELLRQIPVIETKSVYLVDTSASPQDSPKMAQPVPAAVRENRPIESIARLTNPLQTLAENENPLA